MFSADLNLIAQVKEEKILSVDKSLMLFPASSQLSTAGTCRGGSESPGWALGAGCESPLCCGFLRLWAGRPPRAKRQEDACRSDESAVSDSARLCQLSC